MKMHKILSFVQGQIIKKFLEIDYPRSRAIRYYANFLALRANLISNNKRIYGNPGVELRGILLIKSNIMELTA